MAELLAVNYREPDNRILGIFVKSDYPDEDDIPKPNFEITEADYLAALGNDGKGEVNKCDPQAGTVFYEPITQEEIDARSQAMAGRISGLAAEIFIRRTVITVEGEDDLLPLLERRLMRLYVEAAARNPVTGVTGAESITSAYGVNVPVVIQQEIQRSQPVFVAASDDEIPDTPQRVLDDLAYRERMLAPDEDDQENG